ncbi:putative killer cell immunoglobulin-like receptor like protein KIR3DP1 isoform X3 [Mustela erminea]|uniref:putative killer cell immunoglobulin-like receptor like protein KIR3DP1 isoform X3 n=1 Tax=Mustela erminea TaxID=36723 RepID=UPI0013869D9C|nr:putative killer cell immunoglobulin-like receptor like protein KIR3DP1 isoform X3 [Mustela erminea]
MNMNRAPFHDILCTCQLCWVTVQQEQHHVPCSHQPRMSWVVLQPEDWGTSGQLFSAEGRDPHAKTPGIPPHSNMALSCGQNKPFLSAWPSPVVPQGQHVTLHCRSHHKFETFRLYKDNDIFISKLHSTISQYSVLIGPVTPEHAGTYSCCGSYRDSPSLWSAPSDPLVIVVTGIYRKPSLLAQSGRLVKSRGNVTLVCCSEILFESFILHREGVSKDHLYHAGQHHHGGSHANFSMGPVTAAHAGTYRCFGSLNRSSHVWSAPSDPLDIVITGLHEKPSLWTQPGTVVRTGENMTLSCCSERSFDVYHLCRDEQPHECWLAKGQKHGRATQADFPLGPAHPAMGGTYRCHGFFNPSPCEWSGPSDPLYLSVTDAAIMNREPEVDRMVSREDPQAEDPKEVTYTQLDHRIFMQKNTTPTSQRPGEPLHDESVYMELATG